MLLPFLFDLLPIRHQLTNLRVIRNYYKLHRGAVLILLLLNVCATVENTYILNLIFKHFASLFPYQNKNFQTFSLTHCLKQFPNPPNQLHSIS